MGQELHRRFEFVDYVCSGEADESFPVLAGPLGRSTSINVADMPAGIVYRRGDDPFQPARVSPVRQMDSLPIPDFGDYFRQWSEKQRRATVMPTVLMGNFARLLVG